MNLSEQNGGDKTVSYYVDLDEVVSHMRKRQRLSQGTIVTRISRIRIFRKWRSEHHQPLTPQAIEDFFYYLKSEKNLSNTSLNTYYQALLSLQTYLIERNVIKTLLDGIKRFKEEDPNIIPLIPREIQLLKTTPAMHPTYHDVVIFLCDTGSRWEDAQALQCKSVDTAGQQVSYIQVKTKQQRTVHLEEPLVSILEERVKNKHPDTLVFVNQAGNQLHYPDFYQYLKKLAKSVGITKRVSPHILRHSYAQNLYDQTGDIYLVKDVLGHRSITSTMRYLRNSGKRIKQAQQAHPHLLDDVNPQLRIDLLEKEIADLAIDKDTRFDPTLVKEATLTYIVELHKAIKHKNLP